MIPLAICGIFGSSRLDRILRNCHYRPKASTLLFRTPKATSEPSGTVKNEPESKTNGPARVEPRGDDTLAASLTYLAAYHGRAVSREALLGGLPILDGRLSVALYDRAARRAGLETEAIKRDILDIPALVLPAVLIMKNGTALILLGVDQAKQSAKVQDPLAKPGTARVLSLSAIAAEYTGYAFLVRAAAEADARAVAAETCREITGFGRSSRCTGGAMVISRLPRF